mmetsp:Transcript_6600/g.15841  ORF Transcript_6600/g.15841 Transcript_6600/m.15841 type:complete len:110 (+) Transcript_6600:29-358(+)
MMQKKNMQAVKTLPASIEKKRKPRAKVLVFSTKRVQISLDSTASQGSAVLFPVKAAWQSAGNARGLQHPRTQAMPHEWCICSHQGMALLSRTPEYWGSIALYEASAHCL